MADYSEDAAIQQPSIDLLASLGWQTANCFHERFGRGATLGREAADGGVRGARE